MAVYTEVTDDELVRFIADYEIGNALSFKGIAEGVENTNYLVQTESGPHILTLYEKRVAVDDLPFFLGLMEHLAGSGISCPVPVRDKNGEMLRQLAGRPAAIITFLEGLWVRRPTAVHCAALGETLAKLHLAGQTFGMTRKNALSVSGWRPLLEAASGGADTIAPGLDAELGDELSALESAWPSNLPDGIIQEDCSGITAGASAPEVLVDEFIDAFGKRFKTTVETISTADENVSFKLPRELRESH